MNVLYFVYMVGINDRPKSFIRNQYIVLLAGYIQASECLQ